MNILHVYKSAQPEEIGGVGVVIENITRFTVQSGIKHRVLVFTRSKNFRAEYWPCGTEVFFCPQWFSFASMPLSLGYSRKFKELLDWASILHFHHPFPLQDILFLREKKRRKMPPALVTYHSDVVRQRLIGRLYTPIALRFLRSVDKVVATSPGYLHSSLVLRKLSEVEMIPLGISEDVYPSVNLEAVERYKQEIGEGFFLFLGALRYYKGLTWLIEAAKKTGLPVVIAGKGEMENELRLCAEGVHSIKFLTDVSEQDKVALLSLAKVFLFPSHLRSEAFGISLLEAQMMSLPLITCELETGTSYVNLNNVTGLVVPPADSQSLANAMQVLWKDSALCKQMGNASYERFRKLFRAEIMAERYLECYRQLDR